MGKQGKSGYLAAVAFIAPILAGLAAGGAHAAPREADSYLQSGQDLLKNNDLRGAEIQFRNAAQRAPQDGAIRMQLAEIYLLQNNVNAADAELTAAKQRGVTTDRYWSMLAEVRFRESKYGEMLREVPPGNRAPQAESVVRVYRGLSELAIGQKANARTMLEDAERLDPKSVFVKRAMSRVLLSSADAAGAERKIDEVLAIVPHDTRALDTKGILLLMRGDVAEALNSFNSALKEEPGNTTARLDRANLYLGRNEVDLAEKDVQIVEKANPNSAMAIYLEALIAARRGKYQDADAALAKFRGGLNGESDAALLAGIVKYNLNQMEQAETYLTRFVARRQDRPQAYQILGALALRQNNTDRAIAMLNLALNLAPDNPQTIGLLGQAYMARRDSGRALALLDQAVKKLPDNTKLKTALAVSRLTVGETGAGLAELSNVFKSGTGDPLAGPPLILGDLREGRNEQAAATAEALVKQKPDNLFYQQLLATVKAAQGDVPGTEKILREILDKQPNLPTVRRGLAQTYLAMNRPADAKKLFQDKIAKDTNDVDSMEALAGLYALDKNYDAAVGVLARAASAAPADPAPRLQLVSIYGAQKKWPDAIKEARALAVAFSGNVTVRDTLGQIYLASGDVPNGLATYRDAVTAFPNSSQLQARYAVAASAAKDYSTALAALTKAVALDPRNDDLKVGLVMLTIQAKGADAAFATAKSFSSGNPPNPIGDILAADVLIRSAKRGEAIALLEKAQAANASSTVLLKLASVYELNKDTNRAAATLEGWSKNHPDDVVARLQLAQLYGRMRNYNGAQALFEKLAADRPNDPVVLNNLAWVYGRTNDPRARKTAEKAYQLSPGLPQVADTLGWILTNQGDAPNGMKYLQAALNSLPEDPDVQYHFALALSKTNKVGDARAMLQKALASTNDFESKTEAKSLLERLAAAEGTPVPRQAK